MNAASATPSLVVFGARGFLGRSVLQEARGWTVKAVSRTAENDDTVATHVRWYQADMTEPRELVTILQPGDTVVNLAFDPSSSENNVAMITGLVAACRQARVSRLLHCSTALVLGSSREAHVTEDTPCNPKSSYEKTKWHLERLVLAEADGHCDIGIVRPTAIIGPGGKNLVKFAVSIQSGSCVVTYLRACLFGRRHLHLVPVRHVASAILFLAALSVPLQGNVFLISADNDFASDYLTVEGLLRRGLGLPAQRMPRIPLPSLVLRTVLTIMARSDTSVHRIFDEAKLRAMGFTPPQGVADAVGELGKSLRVSP